MKTALTGSLVVCVAAAGIAVGALTLEPGGDPAPAPQPATGQPATGQPSPSPAAPATGQPSPSPAAPAASPYGDAGASAASPTAAGAPASLEISDFAFSTPAVGPGAQVAVSNRDGFPHTVTADDGSFESGTVDAGATGRLVAPSAPGTYPFHCEIHPQMTGALTVG